MIIPIKPLSVNEAYTGRRFSTDAKRQFTKDANKMLVAYRMPPPPYEIHYRFGVSNMGSDVDGGIKVFQDILSKKYKFNDNQVMRIIAEKVRAKLGQEFIEFNIFTYNPNKIEAPDWGK